MSNIRFAAALAAALLAGGSALAEESPLTVAGASTVTTAQAKALFDKGVAFIDPRKDTDFKEGHIPDAVHLDVEGKSNSLTEETLLKALGGRKDADAVVYCNGVTCLRSAHALVKAAAWGFTKLHYYRDGLPAWAAAGLPVER